MPAGPDDFDQEWMALILGVKVVAGVEDAIQHIYDHGSEHSDGILTNDWHNANRFVEAINSSAVFVNASTRFNDGGQFGLGAEVAVSTQKLHARGLGTVMASLTIDFLHEVRAGELDLVKGAVTRVGAKSYSYEMRLYAADAMRHCATEKCTEVCFDTKARKGIALPEDLRKKLTAIL